MLDTLQVAHDHMVDQAADHGINAALLPADDPYSTPLVPGRNCNFDVESSGTDPETGVTYHMTYDITLNAIIGIHNFLDHDRPGSVAAAVTDPSAGAEKCGTMGIHPIED